ncbi:MAG: glycosyltransferase family 4 protein [Lentisphaerae bacterium]|nr:glycosyltransferase family 4 protein [Lentisphaerota bacterium]
MDDRPLSICHVITRMIVGGAQENTLLTARGHVERGHRVTLVTGPSPGPEGALLAAETVPGLEVVEIPSLVRQVSPWHDFLAYRRLRRFFLRGGFDVVHTHSSKAGILGRLAARRAGVPLVVHTVHGQPFHPYQSRWLNAVYIHAERLAARNCDRILAVAQAMVDQCVAAGVAPAERYRVVYSGMDMEAFLNARPDPALRRSLGLPEGVPVVGKIARLFELKGHDFLLAAAPAIVKAIPDAHFLLVGDGVLRESIAARAAALGLQDRFVFTGLVPPAEVCRYTALMDVLVHLSLREGLPRTVVQALASAVPAVGFALDGTPEVIADGVTGRLCPAGDAEAVAGAVIDLLRDPDLRRRLGQAGRERVRTQFCWRRMADLIEQEYRAGLQRRRAV